MRATRGFGVRATAPKSRTKGGTVTSQGQRFRRRALRRGYKVDEVDAFLDRVEATLGGDPIGAAVAAQEVHDVVFRVRFGGYDQWRGGPGGFFPRSFGGHEGWAVRLHPGRGGGPPPRPGGAPGGFGRPPGGGPPLRAAG